LLAFSASGRGLSVASKLLELLAEAASNDWHLEAIAGSKRHCDGYGYIATVRMRDSRSWTVLYEKFDAYPMRGKEACEENLARLKESMARLSIILDRASHAMAIVHSRKSSIGEPRGVVMAHPFREEIIFNIDGMWEVGEVYLAHNGGVDKRRLAEKLSLKDTYMAYTDSYIALKYLARRLNRTNLDKLRSKAFIEAEVSRLKDYVYKNSALNLAIMLVSKSIDPILLAYGYVKSPISDKARWNYYRPIVAWSKGISAYMSSTIWDLAKRELIFYEHDIIHDKLVILRYS